MQVGTDCKQQPTSIKVIAILIKGSSFFKDSFGDWSTGAAFLLKA
jgi:hypothetical protein